MPSVSVSGIPASSSQPSRQAAPQPGRDRATVLVLGLGDLGWRIALGLAHHSAAGRIVLAGRSAERGAAAARLLGACTATPVQFAQVDGLDEDALRRLVAAEQPHLIVQCASLMSPWALPARDDAHVRPLRDAGFALQLSAQIPVIANLMRAVRATAPACPVINCSYPDVTHPILAALGLAPAIGVGNAGMLLGLARAACPDAAQPLRLVAHHAHVGAAVSADRARLQDTPLPRLFSGDTEVPGAAPLFEGAPIPLTRELNALSAAHALAIVDAMLPGAAPLTTSAPGPLGLPGGWPVRIAAGKIELDLPAGSGGPEAFLPLQHAAARADGVDAIAPDGTVHFTDRLRDTLPAALRHLARPLHPDEAPARQRQLELALGAAA